jgi:predicted Ser/Thr protein kinase
MHPRGNDREPRLTPTTTAATSAQPAIAEPVAATLGRYRLERELGSGAIGVVHAAFDPELERRVALKVLRRAAATPEARGRLLREARAMARLAHPNVVAVHEVGTDGGRDFIAMELIDGQTLADWLRSTPRPIAAIIDAFVAAGRGLRAAHAAGIVHRDFKPHNLLRSRDGRIVVTDFGLARDTDRAPPIPHAAASPADAWRTTTRVPIERAALTVTGTVLGTPPYMAPEQWRGGPITTATDQFAYCVAMWEALVGERPYRGPSREDLYLQILRGPGSLDTSRIPRRLRALLRRGLDPDPARRWPSMDALLVVLAQASRRPRVARTSAAAGVVAAALVVIAMRGEISPGTTGEPAAPARERIHPPGHVRERGGVEADATAAPALDRDTCCRPGSSDVLRLRRTPGSRVVAASALPGRRRSSSRSADPRPVIDRRSTAAWISAPRERREITGVDHAHRTVRGRDPPGRAR